ncbi:MAG: L-seryl-tRNA(Sec) selenium transferase [Actinomycetota bacterium]
MTDVNARMRSLPSVERVALVLAKQARRDHKNSEGHGAQPLFVDAARRAVEACRGEIQGGAEAPRFDDVVERAARLLDDVERTQLQPVINATGVLIHTNLGRVPLGERQLEAIARIARGYSNLEYDLSEGRRGSRYSHAGGLITAVTGAESALVVNNNAAAVLLTLAALCTDKEVIISRGELIEIGGEFRMPDVMALSGTRLVEVGTTNRTHLADYERAITADTGAILKVHPSNYKVVGFTAEVTARDLARLAKGRGLPFVHDVGSGFIEAGQVAPWAVGEPPIADALTQGADVVTFSGDKLLGGPQAGIIAGRSDLLGRIAKHPLLRALRVDKMTLAGLEATLLAYLERQVDELPLWSLALTPAEELRERAEGVAAAVAGDTLKAEAVATRAVTGGGSLPGEEIGSWAVVLAHSELGADELQERLRRGSPPIIGRIDADRLVLDLRTVDPSALKTLTQRLTF